MSEWAAVREIDGVTLKVRVPVKALAQLMALAQTIMGGPEPELDAVAAPMVWGWDRQEECSWRALDKWLSEDVERMAAFEGFLTEVALDFFFKCRASSGAILERRPDLDEALQRWIARMKQLSEELTQDMEQSETPQTT